MELKELPAFQVYFRAYMAAHKIEDAAEVKNWEYAQWIQGQHKLFRKTNNLSKYEPYSSEQQAKFEKFIFAFVKPKM